MAKSDKYCPIIFIIWIVNKNKDFKTSRRILYEIGCIFRC